MSFGKRLKAVIKEEGFTQKGFAKEIDTPFRAIEEYIGERNKPSGELFMKIGTHEIFKKYTMWLLGGEIEPESGQVCPDFSTQEQCGLTGGSSQKRA